MKLWPALLATSLIVLSLAVARGDTITKHLADGITLTQEIQEDPPLIINVLAIDPAQPGVRLQTVIGQDTITGPSGDIFKGRGEVRAAAMRHHALAGVNGDYFPFTGDPYGVGITDGRLFSEPYKGGRSAVGVAADGRTLLFDILGFMGDLQAADGSRYFLSGVDRWVSKTDPTDIVAFTPDYGPMSGGRVGGVEVVLSNVDLPLSIDRLMHGTVASVTTDIARSSSIPPDGVVLSAAPGGAAAAFLAGHFHVGDHVEFLCAVAPQADMSGAVKLALAPERNVEPASRLNLAVSRRAAAWSGATQAVGGGPRLMTDGQITVDAMQEGFTDAFANDPNPRTAVGQTADGKILIVTVDGRQRISQGVTLTELAQIMRRLGAVNAINLDGGGSTTMVARDMTVDSPAGTQGERAVADMLLVYAAAPAGADVPGALSLTASSQCVNVGDRVQLSAQLGGKKLDPHDPHILWGAVGDATAGFVGQNGVFYALHGGISTLEAAYEGRTAQVQIEVVGPGPPVKYVLKAWLVLGSYGVANRSELSVAIVDASGTPLTKAGVHVAVQGGTADFSDLVTDADGEATTGITWNGAAGSVTVTSGSLKAVTVTYGAAATH